MEGWIPLSHYVAGVPERGQMVVHLDRNIRNNDRENVMIVNKSASAMMTGCRMWSENPCITKTGIMACELKLLIDDSKRRTNEIHNIR